MLKTVYAREYGIIPDTREDSTKAFELILKENIKDTLFIIDKGRYDFYSDKAEHMEFYLSNSDVSMPKCFAIVMRGMCNIDFDGNGAEFIFHGQVLPVFIDNSTNITLLFRAFILIRAFASQGMIIISSC